MTRAATDVPAHHPTCPRCGYDQSGVIASWTASCPLVGRCSECGLDFSWRDVLNPRWIVPAWSFEHCRGWWQVGKHLRTCLRAWRPWSFWRAMRMELPLRSLRLWRHLAAMLLAFHLVFAISAAWQVWDSQTGWVAWWRAQGLNPDREALLATIDAFVWPYWEVAFLGSSMGSWRPYAIGRFELFLLLWMAATPMGFFILIDTFRRVRVRYVHLWRGLVYSTTAMPLWALVLGFCSSEWLGSLLDTLTTVYAVPWDSIGEITARSLIAIAAAWHALFWWTMVRFYLRLPHAEGVAAAMLVISGLLVFILMLIAFVMRVWITN